MARGTYLRTYVDTYYSAAEPLAWHTLADHNVRGSSMGVFDWIKRQHAAAKQRELEEEAREKQRAAENAARSRAARQEALAQLEAHAAHTAEAHSLIISGRRSEAEKSFTSDSIESLMYYVTHFGPQRGLEYFTLAPFWDELGNSEVAHKDVMRWIRMADDPPRKYDRFFSPRIPTDMRAAIERGWKASGQPNGKGHLWTSSGMLMGWNDDGGPIGYEGEGNLLTVAPPGAGKSQCHVLPNIFLYDGPLFILDIKRSENLKEVERISSDMSMNVVGRGMSGQLPIYRFDPANPSQSVIYNPLEFLPTNLDTLWSAAGRMAEWLCVPGKSADSYFEDRARQWTRGLVAATVVLARNASTIPNMGSIVDFVFADTVSQDEFLATVALLEEKPLANLAKNILSTSERERSATMNTIAKSLEAWQDPVIQKLTSGKSTWHPISLMTHEERWNAYTYEDFGDGWEFIEAIASKEQTMSLGKRFFLCMPAGDVRTATSIVRVIIGQHIDFVMERDKGHNTLPIMFLLDEFPQLGRMESIMRGVEMGRAAGLRFWFFAQDLQQIGRSYAPEDEAVILGSCAMQCFMNINTMETAQAVSQRLGETRGVFVQDKRPICAPDDLMNSPKWRDAIICLRRQEEPIVFDKLMMKDIERD